MEKLFRILIIWCVLFLGICPLYGAPKDTIVIIGSEPECIAAAVTASRLGYDVKLITEDSELGGLLTQGMLTVLDINFDYNNRVLHNGFFKEFLDACSNGYTIDAEKTKVFFDEMVKKYHIQVIYDAKDIKPLLAGHELKGVCYQTANSTFQKFYCSAVLDGSSEARFSRKLGVSYKMGRAEFGTPHKSAAASLIFSVKKINWKMVINHLSNDQNQHSHYNKNAAWGFNIMYQYPSSNPRIQMRGLNLSRQADGSVIINALLIFGVDPLSHDSLQEAYQIAKNELPFIVSYLSKHCPGFEKAVLNKTAAQLYVREGVRIIGIDTLSGTDVLEHVDFPNTIAYGSYPIDLQASERGQYGNALCGKCIYSIPLGCMIPKGTNNLIVLGRSAGFDIIAHGSARTVPVLMSMAENAAVAVHYCIQHGLSLKELNHSSAYLQGLYTTLNQFNDFKKIKLPENIFIDKWYYPYLHDLMARGCLSLGYTNRNLEDTEYSIEALSTTINLLISHFDYKISDDIKQYIHGLKEPITAEKLCKLASLMLHDDLGTVQRLYNKGIIDEITYQHIYSQEALTQAEVYTILDSIFKKITPNTPIILSKDAIDVINEKK